LGKTNFKTSQRKEYAPSEGIIDELKNWLQNNSPEAKSLNYITCSGSGEPTLNTGIGNLIQEIKRITSIPIAVITNASFLDDPSLRAQLMPADLIIPSLDAAGQGVFEKINRPDTGIALDKIIVGLISLKKEFKGQIWLEVMLVRGLNDDLRLIKKLKEIVDRINPDKIQLNSPVRSTAEPNILPVDRKKLEKIKEILGDKCEII
jgi:wyosine [tRNA(Phe)-imidazoG37] synthetase (radical SAM superfamily)